MIRKARVEEKENVQKGNGRIVFHHILEKDELYGHGRMFADVVIPPGGSIGFHQHTDETEPYYVLEGEGIFHDADGSEHVIVPGDVCVIDVGASHWIENRSDAPLRFIALIYNGEGVLR